MCVTVVCYTTNHLPMVTTSKNMLVTITLKLLFDVSLIFYCIRKNSEQICPISPGQSICVCISKGLFWIWFQEWLFVSKTVSHFTWWLSPLYKKEMCLEKQSINWSLQNPLENKVKVVTTDYWLLEITPESTKPQRKIIQ